METNRRNYYRILRVQPDASTAVIRNNYRTLLQKLRQHPDLGGDHWNASLLNIAYRTLNHPARRAAYDRELLQQYRIKDLSQGQLGRTGRQAILKTVRDDPGNQRNYYRILHIQSDSPPAIVDSSYQTLKARKEGSLPARLLDEAHTALSNPLKRALYDRLLQQYSHADAVELISKTFRQAEAKGKRGPARTTKPAKHATPTQGHGRPTDIRAYAPVIRRYCSFCKTPHEYAEHQLQDVLCSDCQSPLAPPSAVLSDLPRRHLRRVSQGGAVDIWLDWPDYRRSARLLDLSPTGLRLSLDQPLDTGQLLKIEAPDFRAVGETSHCQPRGQHFIVGLRFISVRFEKQRGQFLQTSI